MPDIHERTVRKCLLLAGCLLGLWAVPSGLLRGEEVSPVLPAADKFHIYLLMGQSNMAGRGVVEPQDKVPHSRVLVLNKELKWAPAIDPLHYDKPAIAGVGLGSSFGRAMAEANPEVVIGLVPCAFGGTPLSRWQQEGDLYKTALERAKAARKSGVIKGVLWHQGENDASEEQTARNYGSRLAKMVNDLRIDLGDERLPFVAGELGQFLKRVNPDGKPNFWPVVNEELAGLPKNVTQTAVVASKDLQHKGDDVHFDTPSLKEFGKRYASAMLQLQKQADSRK